MSFSRNWQCIMLMVNAAHSPARTTAQEEDVVGGEKIIELRCDNSDNGLEH
jgi:hypothetical protein